MARCTHLITIARVTAGSRGLLRPAFLDAATTGVTMRTVRPTLVGLIVLLLLSAEQVLAQAPPALVIEAPPELAVARARLDSYDLRPLSAIVRLVGLDAPGPPPTIGRDQARLGVTGSPRD